MTISLSKLGLTVGMGMVVAMGTLLPTQASTVSHNTEAEYAEVGLAQEGAIAAHHESEALKTIVETAAGNDIFSTLVAAVKAAELVETLSGDGPFTVFAPTNDAFAALPEGTVESLLLPENQAMLQKILTYHVVAGVVPSSAIQPGTVPTVEGNSVQLSIEDGAVMVDGATVIMPDVQTSNGVIHVIDAVLLPPAQ